MELLPGGLAGAKGLIEHEVSGAEIHAGNEKIRLKRKGTAAYVIDRDMLDRELASHAISAGCEMCFSSPVDNVSFMKNKASVKCGKKVYESKIVVGCDGARSVVGRCMDSYPQEMLNGLVVTVDESDFSEYVGMWFVEKDARNGFLWKIPRGKCVEYGGMGTGLNFRSVENFFSIRESDIMHRKAAPIPIGAVKTYNKRGLLVGDAACQTKPWSGGGIMYGMIAAKVAAATIKSAFECDDFSEGVLSGYETGWKKILFRDIRAGLLLRGIYSDFEAGHLIRIVSRLRVAEALQGKIDFDFPFSSILGLKNVA